LIILHLLLATPYALYSFAVDGGAVSTITPATNCTLPAKAVMVSSTVDVTTAITSGGAPNIAVGTTGTGGTTGDILAAALKASYSAGIKSGLITFAAPLKITTSGTITVTVTTAVLTAGVMDIWVQYYVATN
jgi:hypothetical protein